MVSDDGDIVTPGAGLTVTVIVTGAPLQLFADGVMTYSTVPELLPSALLSVWLITLPEPDDAPETLSAF